MPSWRNSKEIGAKVKAIRQAKGLTQQSVADSLQLHQSAYANSENGNRQFSAWELLQISQLFGFKLDAFRKELEADHELA